MGSIVKQLDAGGTSARVRCPICAHGNAPMEHCRHVRWTFDQGDPIDFARFAMGTSPYTSARGFSLSEITPFWWEQRGEWVVEQVMLHFEAVDGYVFGEIADLDLLSRDVWKAFRPDPLRAEMARVDPL